MNITDNTTQKNSSKSLAMLVSSMLAFGTIGIFRRMIPLPSALIAFFRGITGALFLIIFVMLRGKSHVNSMSRKDAIKLALSGIAIGFNWILLFEAYNYTSVSVATLCYYMQPTFVILMSVIFFREKMTLRKGLCTIFSLIGMVLISGVIDSGMPGNSELKGIIFGLGAGFLYSIVVMINKSTGGVDSFQKTIIQLSAAGVIMIPYLLITGEFSGNAWSVKTILLLLLVGIFHTGICYALYFGSIDGLRTQTVALFSYIDPVTALILSAILLNEQMNVTGWIGAALILGSAVYSEIKA